MVMAADTDIRDILKKMPQTIRVGSRAGGLSEFLSIQAAVNYCDAQGGDWVIEIYSQGPGGYNEGDITPAGGANITLRGMGVERVSISPVAVPAAAVIVSGFNLALENLIVAAPTNARPALRVTGGTCHATSCSLIGVGAGDSIQQVGGDLTLDACRVPQDLDLSTAACDLWINYSLVEGGIDTAGDFVHRMWIKETNFNNSNLNSLAIGATLLFMEGCSYVGVVINAGTGVFEIRDSYTTEIQQTNAAGFTYLFGGDVIICGASVGLVTWLKSDFELRVIAGMKIDHALLVAIAGTTITIGPGIFAESNLVMLANVHLVGTDPELTQIIFNSAANPIIACAVNCSISNLTIGNLNAGAPAVAVSANTLNLRNCTIYGTGAGDAIAMTGGTLNMFDSTVGVGDIDLSTAACTLAMYFCRITTDPLDTAAGAFAHNITLIGCDFNGQNLTSAATGATTLAMKNCSHVGTIRNAGTGAFTIRASEVFSINATATGTFTIYGGFVNSITRAAASVVWWQDENTLKVIPSATSTDTVVQYAINAAAAGDVVLIHPGTYDEFVTCKNGVDLKGVGPKGSVIIQQTDALVMLYANDIEVDNLTIRMVTPSVGRTVTELDGVGPLALRNVIFEVTNPAAWIMIIVQVIGAANVTIERCSYSIGGTGTSVGLWNSNNAATFKLIQNDFTFNNVNAVHIFSSQAGTWTGGQNRWAGTCGLFNVTLGTITLDGDQNVCTAVSIVAAAATVLMREGLTIYHVYPGMDIQDALTAGAGLEVVIHAGAHAPIANLTVAANTLVRGEGKATIITPTGAAITNGIILNGNNITLKDMKVILAAGAGAGGSRPNVVYASGKTLLWLENLWLVGDQSVADDGDSERQNGVCFITCTYSKVVNCHSQANRWSGIILKTSSNYNTVTGNTCQGQTWRYGIYLLVNSNYNTVTGNTCQGNYSGILLESTCNRNTITGNTCQGNQANGIYLRTSSYNTITGNTCQGNGYGISLWRSSYCVITGNSCNGSTTADGIQVEGDVTANSDYNTITGNVCTGNADDGIEIIGGAFANKNIILGNQLLGNVGTPLVDGGTNTEVAHNITL